MELSGKIWKQTARPSGVFSNIEELLAGTGYWCTAEPSSPLEIPWQQSQLNPRNRINSLGIPRDSYWRIDGLVEQGRRALVTPVGIQDWPPLRIDVILPDQSSFPPLLRHALQSAKSFYVGGQRAASLGISCHLLRVLNHWTALMMNPENTLRSMTFGSTIIVKAIVSNIQEVELHMENNQALNAGLCKAELGEKWTIPNARLPETIKIRSLVSCAQISETISIVKTGLNTLEPLVFKSSTQSLRYLYHELKILLIMPRHRSVIGRPKWLVTSTENVSGKEIVIGFLAKYYEEGTMARCLDTAPDLSLHEKLHWGRLVTEVMVHITFEGETFYPDMKPENILLVRRGEAPLRDIVLIDFEQRGIGNTWTAPEIIYGERLNSILKSMKPGRLREVYKALWLRYLGYSHMSFTEHYNSPPDGYHPVWPLLTKQEQESAQVFTLGKVLYCIFEARSCVETIIDVSFPYERHGEFPTFVNTPPEMQDLIINCTVGAREFKKDRPFLVRRGDFLYPKGKTGRGNEPTGTANDTKQTARQMWLSELRNIEEFINSKAQFKAGCADIAAMERLSYLKRPSLDSVLQCIVEFQKQISNHDSLS